MFTENHTKLEKEKRQAIIIKLGFTDQFQTQEVTQEENIRLKYIQKTDLLLIGIF